MTTGLDNLLDEIDAGPEINAEGWEKHPEGDQ